MIILSIYILGSMDIYIYVLVQQVVDTVIIDFAEIPYSMDRVYDHILHRYAIVSLTSNSTMIKWI